MLTREEAKQCKCAYLTMDKVHDVNMQILKEGGTKEELKQALTDWLESTRCKAENCPKWKDEIIRLDGWKGIPKAWCSHFEECPFLPEENSKSIDHEKYLKHCLECDNHFGRCGG